MSDMVPEVLNGNRFGYWLKVKQVQQELPAQQQ